MEGTVYPQKLTAAGIEYVGPDTEERARIDHIIFDELVKERNFHRGIANLLSTGNRSHEGRRLRRCGTRLYRDSAHHRRPEFAAANPRLDPHPGAGGNPKGIGINSNRRYIFTPGSLSKTCFSQS